MMENSVDESKRPNEDANSSDVDSERGTSMVHKFIRVIAGRTLVDAESLLGSRVPWLSRLQVYSSKVNKISRHQDYELGNVIGMDAASALTVEILDIRPGQYVLDLCCAPGVKLSAIADLMDKRGTLVGVDISEMRLNTTAAILRKYKACLRTEDSNDAQAEKSDWKLTIWQCDGRTFDPSTTGASRGVLRWSSGMNAKFLGGKHLVIPRKRAGKGLRKIMSRQAKEEEYASMPNLFDRVLVDAECTTDGRAHLRTDDELNYKRKRWAGENGVPSKDEQAATEQLQLELLKNGFRLLAPGGSLVYSTCSMLEGQNEHVVSRFLSQEPAARLANPIGEGMIPGAPATLAPVLPSETLGPFAWRLTPEVSGTSGMFLAKIVKDS